MTESLSKKRGTRNVYIRHIENLANEIKETLVNFDISNSRHRERLKGLKYSLDDKIKKIAILDNEFILLLFFFLFIYLFFSPLMYNHTTSNQLYYKYL